MGFMKKLSGSLAKAASTGLDYKIENLRREQTENFKKALQDDQQGFLSSEAKLSRTHLDAMESKRLAAATASDETKATATLAADATKASALKEHQEAQRGVAEKQIGVAEESNALNKEKFEFDKAWKTPEAVAARAEKALVLSAQLEQAGWRLEAEGLFPAYKEGKGVDNIEVYTTKFIADKMGMKGKYVPKDDVIKAINKEAGEAFKLHAETEAFEIATAKAKKAGSKTPAVDAEQEYLTGHKAAALLDYTNTYSNKEKLGARLTAESTVAERMQESVNQKGMEAAIDELIQRGGTREEVMAEMKKYGIYAAEQKELPEDAGVLGKPGKRGFFHKGGALDTGIRRDLTDEEQAYSL